MRRICTQFDPADSWPRGYVPIEEYAAIGDRRSLALVSIEGSIDWMCAPELDSPAIFAAILDPERGGRFHVRPAIRFTTERRYLDRSNVLETTFSTEQGKVRLTDALTISPGIDRPARELVRSIDCLSGSVPLEVGFEPRFDFGRRPASFGTRGAALVTEHGGLQLGLVGSDLGEPEVTAGRITFRTVVEDGRQAVLVMTVSTGASLPIPSPPQARQRVEATSRTWRDWLAGHTYDGPWATAVERSLLAIGLLSDGRTGAIAAAATNSLPEVLGGQRNYDYRFGWVRDTSFALDALVGVGMDEVMHPSINWLLNATSCTQPRVDPVYTLDGDVLRSQHTLPLAGYRNTSPVHLGNAAGKQLQLGGFGDLMETLARYVRAGHVISAQTGERLADIADLLSAIWPNEDAGLWELGDYAQYGTSKLSCWVAFDRILTLAGEGHAPARHIENWRKQRRLLADFIETRLFSQARGTYLQKAGADALDCGMLLAARRGFGASDGRRISGTIDAIRSELSAGGPLLYRYSGMQDEENAFLACSFWLIEALALTGRRETAGELMDSVVGLASDTGLYSEEMDPSTHGMRGNFPQALTHLALIGAAVALARADKSESSLTHTAVASDGVSTRRESGNELITSPGDVGPPMDPNTGEADSVQLALARVQGQAYGRALAHMTESVAHDGGEQEAGDYRIGYAVEEAEGMYEWADGELRWRTPDGKNLHLEIAVRDRSDGRFVPGARVLATLTSPGGEDIGTHEQPLLWHPMIYHYGRNWTVPSDGEYTLRVRVEPPAFMRHDEVNGRRFAEPVEVEFRGVKVRRGTD